MGLRISLRRLANDDRGAALVEFGLLLPTLLLFFALVIEGSRTFWSYQAVIAGVRDATRFVGRAEASTVCTAGGSVARWTTKVTQIVRETADGGSIFPGSIAVGSVTPTLRCVAGGYRIAQVPVVTVTANLTITYPFAGLFELAGVALGTARTSVADSTRVYGS